jgi:hypothetical protein
LKKRDDGDASASRSSRKGGHKRGLKWILITSILVLTLAMGAVAIAASQASSPNTRFGGINSAHEHAAFIIVIEGKRIDFGQEKYQVKSPFIHVENMIGTTIHKHANQVPVGEFLKSVGMGVTDNSCFVSDDGKQYCSTGTGGKTMRFFVNGAEREPKTIMNYVFNDDDRFMLIYGAETQEQIDAQLATLNRIPIFRS